MKWPIKLPLFFPLVYEYARFNVMFFYSLDLICGVNVAEHIKGCLKELIKFLPVKLK